MSFVATFYNNASDNNVVNKKLTTLGVANVDITDNFTIDQASFRMARNDNLLSANYMFVPQFNRYYNITIDIEDGVFMRIKGESDPLKSFWSSIKQSPCVAFRSSSSPDPRIEDDKVFKAPKPTIIYRKIGQPFTLSNQNNYILTVTGRGV